MATGGGARSMMFRRMMSSSTTGHHKSHQSRHQYSEAESWIGSWESPKTPEEGKWKLAVLRRDYGKKVKAVRKEYIKEVEGMRVEKERKDAAKKEAIRVATEERNKLKAQAAQLRAQQRTLAQHEFRQILLKERAEKLEYWRMNETKRQEKKKTKAEGLHMQSSLWIDQNILEKKILETIVQGPAWPSYQNNGHFY
ncbi:hypothetical protein M5689_022759 [Euphorbia peplus]|nr:hypothetical protein M5689_022759 [Euphorbia peplus]